MPRTGELDPKDWPEARGMILRYVYRQERKHREVTFMRIWAFVRDEGFRITLEDLQTALLDLKQCGYVQFKKTTDARTGESRHHDIRTMPKGRNLVEETANDPSVRIDISTGRLEEEA